MTSFVRSRQQQNKSASYQAFFGIQKGCQEQMRRLFEVVESEGSSNNNTPAQLREELFLRAVQAKNDCFARSICPSLHADALQCVLRPEKVASGACRSALESVSECVTGFWKKTINAKTQELMQRYERCNQGCAPALEEYQKCMTIGGGGEKCAPAMMAVETCLGSCLNPAAAVALTQCRSVGGSRCEAEERVVVGARAAAGKEILLSMGFSEHDMTPTETSEQIMGVVGVVMFTGDIENQMMQQRK